MAEVIDGSIRTIMEEPNQALTPGWLFRSCLPPLKTAFATAVVVAGLVIFLPNQFRSIAKVLPGNDRPLSMLSQVQALAPQLGLGGAGQEGDAIYTEVLSSWWLHERLLETPFTFHQRSWRFGPLVEKSMTWREYLKKPTVDEAVQVSLERVRVRKDIKTRAITIEVETRSADLSQQVAHRTLALLEEFLVKKTNSRGSSKAHFITTRLEEAQAQLAQTEDEMKQWFKEGHANYLTSPDPITRLEGAHLEAKLALSKQKIMTLATLQEQALMEEKNDVPTLNVLDEGNLPERKSSPQRGLMVIAWFALVFLGDWSRRNHPVLRAALAPGTHP